MSGESLIRQDGFWAALISAIILGGLVLIIHLGQSWGAKRDLQFIEHGYTRATIQGSPYVQWVLPDSL